MIESDLSKIFYVIVFERHKYYITANSSLYPGSTNSVKSFWMI